MLLTLQGEIFFFFKFFIKHCYQIFKETVKQNMCAIFRAKMVSTTLALRTTKFLRNEVEYMPWQTANRNLDYFYLMFDRSEVYGHMQVR